MILPGLSRPETPRDWWKKKKILTLCKGKGNKAPRPARPKRDGEGVPVSASKCKNDRAQELPKNRKKGEKNKGV